MRFLNTRKLTVCLILAGLLLWPVFLQAAKESAEPDKGYGASEAHKVSDRPEKWTTADHENFEKLQQDFQSGPEVTEACLSCHNDAGEQVSETIHWTWKCPADPSGKMGKDGLTLNNF
ncbi:MAG: hypothetical protein R6U97_09660 [Desulfosalsimonas sp.]